MQRQVRLYLHTHGQQLLGHKGPTALPTTAVVLTLFLPVLMVHVRQGKRAVHQMAGVHAYHVMVCDALGSIMLGIPHRLPKKHETRTWPLHMGLIMLKRYAHQNGVPSHAVMGALEARYTLHPLWAAQRQ